jgi:hypothetical protein
MSMIECEKGMNKLSRTGMVSVPPNLLARADEVIE